MKRKGEKDATQLDEAIVRMEQEFLRNFPPPDITASKAHSAPGLKRRRSSMNTTAKRTSVMYPDEASPSTVEAYGFESGYFEDFASAKVGADFNYSGRYQGEKDVLCDQRMVLKRQGDSSLSQTAHSAKKMRSAVGTYPSP